MTTPATPMHKVLGIIRDEHRSLSAVLSGLCELARMARDPAMRPDFAVFRAMLYYIDTFPEREHHPKEDAYLFARLATRDPEAAELIDALKAEHVEGAQLVRELERSLSEFELVWPEGTKAFEAIAQSYAQFHWNHMRREEQELLPRAERVLTAADWEAMETAFGTNVEPIGDLRHTNFKALFQRILHLAPVPVGLGKPWPAAA